MLGDSALPSQKWAHVPFDMNGIRLYMDIILCWFSEENKKQGWYKYLSGSKIKQDLQKSGTVSMISEMQIET